MWRTILEIAFIILVLRFLNNLFSRPSTPPNNNYQPPRQQPTPPSEPKKEQRKPSDDEYIDYEEIK